MSQYDRSIQQRAPQPLDLSATTMDGPSPQLPGQGSNSNSSSGAGSKLGGQTPTAASLAGSSSTSLVVSTPRSGTRPAPPSLTRATTVSSSSGHIITKHADGGGDSAGSTASGSGGGSGSGSVSGSGSGLAASMVNPSLHAVPENALPPPAPPAVGRTTSGHETPRSGLHASMSTVSPRSGNMLRRSSVVVIGGESPPRSLSVKFQNMSTDEPRLQTNDTDLQVSEADNNPFANIDPALTQATENNRLFTSARYFDRSTASTAGPTLYALFCSQARPVPAILTVGTGDLLASPELGADASSLSTSSGGGRPPPVVDLDEVTLRKLSTLSHHKRQASGNIFGHARTHSHQFTGASSGTESGFINFSSPPTSDPKIPGDESEPFVLGITFTQMCMLLKFMSIYPASGESQVLEWVSLVDDGRPEYYKFLIFAQIVDMAVSANNALFELSYPKVPLPCALPSQGGANTTLTPHELQEFQLPYRRIPTEQLPKTIPLAFPPITQDPKRILSEASITGFKRVIVNATDDAYAHYQEQQLMVPVPDIFVLGAPISLISSSEYQKGATEVYVELLTLAQQARRSIFLPELVENGEIRITRATPSPNVPYFGHLSRFGGVVYTFNADGPKAYVVDLLTEKRLRQRARCILALGLLGTPQAAFASIMEECLNPLRTYKPKVGLTGSRSGGNSNTAAPTPRAGTAPFVTGPCTLVPSLVLVLNEVEPTNRSDPKAGNAALLAVLASCATERGLTLYSAAHLAFMELSRRLTRPYPPMPAGPVDPDTMLSTQRALREAESGIEKLHDTNAELEHKLVVMGEELDKARAEIERLSALQLAPKPPTPKPSSTPEPEQELDPAERAHLSTLNELSMLTESCLDFASAVSPLRSHGQLQQQQELNASVVSIPVTPRKASVTPSNHLIACSTPKSAKQLLAIQTTPIKAAPGSPGFSRVGLPVTTPFRIQLAALQEQERQNAREQMEKELEARLQEQREVLQREQEQQRKEWERVREELMSNHIRARDEVIQIHSSHEQELKESFQQREAQLRLEFEAKLTAMQQQLQELLELQRTQQQQQQELQLLQQLKIKEQEEQLRHYQESLDRATAASSEQAHTEDERQQQMGSQPASAQLQPHGTPFPNVSDFESSLDTPFQLRNRTQHASTNGNEPPRSASKRPYKHVVTPPLVRELNDILNDEGSENEESGTIEITKDYYSSLYPSQGAVNWPSSMHGYHSQHLNAAKETPRTELKSVPYSYPTSTDKSSSTFARSLSMERRVTPESDALAPRGYPEVRNPLLEQTWEQARTSRQAQSAAVTAASKPTAASTPTASAPPSSIPGLTRHPGLVYTEKHGGLLGPMGPGGLATMYSAELAPVGKGPSAMRNARRPENILKEQVVPFAAAKAQLKILEGATRALHEFRSTSGKPI